MGFTVRASVNGGIMTSIGHRIDIWMTTYTLNKTSCFQQPSSSIRVNFLLKIHASSLVWPMYITSFLMTSNWLKRCQFVGLSTICSAVSPGFTHHFKALHIAGPLWWESKRTSDVEKIPCHDVSTCFYFVRSMADLGSSNVISRLIIVIIVVMWKAFPCHDVSTCFYFVRSMADPGSTNVISRLCHHWFR